MITARTSRCSRAHARAQPICNKILPVRFLQARRAPNHPRVLPVEARDAFGVIPVALFFAPGFRKEEVILNCGSFDLKAADVIKLLD